MAVRVTEENFNSEVLEVSGIVIADFYSDSCIPCKRLSPVLAEVEEENPDVKLVKMNVGFDRSLAEKYEVQAVPTLIFFKNGTEAERTRGTVKKADITEILNKLR
ncbi:MAG: thioredoxin family protein [Oscillospiraceae bacterium]|nr:thioredoxin family protein [Oscillospiraceae bacterium]